MSRKDDGYKTLIEFLRTAEMAWEASRLFFAKWDLSPAQYNVLSLLHAASEGLTQTELSKSLLNHRSNLTGLIDRLVERKLVERSETPGDRRAWQIRITREGVRLFSGIEKEFVPHASSLMEGIKIVAFGSTLKVLQMNTSSLLKELRGEG